MSANALCVIESGYDEEMTEDEEPASKKKPKTKPVKAKVKSEDDGVSPNKRKKKQEDEPEVWKWLVTKTYFKDTLSFFSAWSLTFSDCEYLCIVKY